MSSTKKTILGILTVLPLIFLFIYFVKFFSMIMSINSNSGFGGQSDPDMIFSQMVPLFALIGTSVLLTFGLLIYYIIDIVNNPKFQSGGNSKLIWIIAVIIGGMIGMIAYFLVEIYPRKELPPLPPRNNV